MEFQIPDYFYVKVTTYLKKKDKQNIKKIYYSTIHKFKWSKKWFILNNLCLTFQTAFQF